MTQRIFKLTALVVAGKGFIFIFHLLVARSLGLGKVTDMFYFTLGVVSLLVSVLGVAIESAIVPVYLLRKKAGSHLDDINRLASQLLCVLVFLSCLTIIGVRLVAPGFSIFSLAEVSSIQWMFAALLPYLLLNVLISLQRGVFNAEEAFLVGSGLAICEGIVSLVLLFLLIGKFGILAVLFSMGGGALCGCLLGWLLLQKRLGGRLAFRFRWNDLWNGDLLIGHLSLPIFGTAIIGINPLVDQFFLSKAGVGVITAFFQASRIFVIPVNLLISGLLPVLLTRFSILATTGDIQGYRRLLRRVLSILLPTSVVIAVGLILSSRSLIGWMFAQSRVVGGDIEMISNIFIFLLIGLAPYMATSVLARANLARRHYWFIFYISIGNVVLNVLLNMILFDRFGYIGIPLATSITYTAIFLALYLYSMHNPKKIGTGAPPLVA